MKLMSLALAAAALAGPVAAFAQPAVTDAWVRGTVPQQTSTGLYFTLTSPEAARLVAVASPVAASVQMHEMSMKGDVMVMRPVAAIELPAGKPVSLSPGGAHVMLVGLKHPLRAGDDVPATLTVVRADGRKETIDVHAHVEPLGAAHPAPTASMAMPMGGMASMAH